MRKRVWVRVIAVVGLACVLGAGWALGSPRVQDIQQLQPALEIPLYEGAQVEWEVHLTAQEMAQGLYKWVDDLAVLKIAGYTIAGGRALEVLNFYKQALEEWRQVLWVKPAEAGGVRLLAKDQSYLFIAVSKGYETTDLVIALAHADGAAVDVPVFEGAELQWEVVLTTRDLLEYLKRWFGDLITNPLLAMRMRIWGQPERPQDSLIEFMSWLGVLGIEALFRLFQDFSDVGVVGYRLDGNKALEVFSFYEQQFGNWTRNFWVKPEESGGMRIFSQGSAEGLKELILIIINSMTWAEVTDVIVLRARR